MWKVQLFKLNYDEREPQAAREVAGGRWLVADGLWRIVDGGWRGKMYG